jgi:hypothetical protein
MDAMATHHALKIRITNAAKRQAYQRAIGLNPYV